MNNEPRVTHHQSPVTHHDFIVVGSGAGGAAAAWQLTQSGRSVLLLEKGEALPLDGSTLDFTRVIGDGIFKSREPWLDKDGREIVPEEYFNVGGKTKWYGAALLRYDRHEFDADMAFRCLGWPLSYDDLAPFYARAEQLLGVRTFDIEPDLLRIKTRVESNGSAWRGQPLPLALSPEILAHEDEARHFDGFASVRGLKADAQQSLLTRIADRGNVRLLTGQAVHGLLGAADAPERITGVRLADGSTHSADVVLLAAGAMHSPRLLQRYLDNSSLASRLPSYRLVGCYFKRHLLTVMLAVSASKKSDRLRKTTVWLNERLPHSSVQPLGFSEDVLSSLIPRRVPRWIAREFGARAYGFFLQTEDGSDVHNRVIAETNGTGQGITPPTLDYDPARTPAAVDEHRHMVRSFRAALLKAGLVSFVQTIPLTGTAHACGTLLTGTDARESVVDANGKVHGMEGLYVVDGSVLPRSSRVNPSLTIYAWALRVAERLSNGS